MIVTGTKTGTKYEVIKWTNPSIKIVSCMSSSKVTFGELIVFRELEAGPVQ